MNLRQMELFLKVIEYNGFLPASQHLYMSQSAVSQQIIRMEQELGFSLFERKGRHIQLTESGRIYADAVAQILKIHLHALEACSNAQHDPVQSVIGCTGFTYYFLLPEAIKELHKLIPNVSFSTVRVSPEHLADSLKSNKIDIVYAPEHIAKRIQGIKFKMVCTLPFYCVVNQDSPLAGKSSIQYSDLIHSILVLPDPKYSSDQVRKIVAAVSSNCKKAGVSIRLLQGTDVDNAVFQAVSDKDCVAILPEYTLPLHTDLVAVPLKEAIRIGIGFGYLKRLSNAEEYLISLCTKIQEQM